MITFGMLYACHTCISVMFTEITVVGYHCAASSPCLCNDPYALPYIKVKTSWLEQICSNIPEDKTIINNKDKKTEMLSVRDTAT